MASLGEKTAAAQQFRTLMQHTSGTGRSDVPHPHRQFMLDLQAWITSLQQSGTYIIILMDNNEDIVQHQGSCIPLEYIQNTILRAPNHNAALATQLQSCNLVDSLAVQHPPPFPPTYIRGKKRLDYILISAELSETIQHSGILPFHSLCLGDHRACYIDLDAPMLFGSSTSAIIPPSKPLLTAEDP
jgi:exonuclease III